MEKGEPPSSVSSNTPPVHPDDALQSGFQQLIQHNAATSSPYHASEVQSIDMGGHTGLSTHSRYPSPVPQQNMMPAYDHHSPMNQTPPYAAPGYPGEYQTAYPADPSPYPQLPDVGPSIVGEKVSIVCSLIVGHVDTDYGISPADIPL
ncbi:hypothetical protein F5Y18DRAFT_267761 [Xylariaceae sp. FL1019]|nr:hypothetical protein F5Y18DRAFT_267761 [Xylariaceae sp. FL1019]